jgi:hypothetical protein
MDEESTFSNLRHPQEDPTKIYCDNNSAIDLSKNHVVHKHSKNIDTQYHFIQELVTYILICVGPKNN